MAFDLLHKARLATVLLAGSVSLMAQLNSSAFDGLPWRSIGPAATGGRIADLAIAKVPNGPEQIFVATTSGGVFKSVNAGVSFTPMFDKVGGMMSMGAIAVAPSNSAVVWVGTGEADNRQSSSWGDGVYKSMDGGTTWQKMGLADTRHIGKIVIHPTDPNTVYVAAVGHLWGSNAERGVFKTSDGGKSWKKVLYKDDNTGAIDLVMDPKNPDVLFAAMYQRQRKGWGYNGGGPGSGIYRSTDGGATWMELKKGLPSGDKGRIGLSIFAGDNRIIYAIVEADPQPAGREGGGPEPAAATPAGRGGAARAIPGQGGIFRSMDQGETWEHMSGLNPRPCYYSRIYVDPKDVNHVYIMGSNRGLFVSEDGARNFREVFSEVHGEDHVMWIDPDSTNHLIIGGDGGVSISYDRGQTWLFRINLPLGQFYNISANNGDPFLVCGGLQDNGSWCTPTASKYTHGISFKDAFNVGSGDGMHAMFDGDDRTILVSSQNGVTNRMDLDTMERQSIGPVQPAEKPQPGKPGYRWYWTSPIVVSSFTPNTIYTAANVVFRSDDRGVSWKAISPDLTADIDREKLEMMGRTVPPNALSRHDGQTNFSALTVIAESPMDKNLLYTGADDGTVQVTHDGGKNWTNLTANLHVPARLNISGIVASKYAAGRVYLTVDGHFNDDYHPYVFVSEDYGKTWNEIVTGLPQTSVHRIREHSTNPNFLVIGMETGVYATFDRGAHWSSLGANMPPVPVYDLLFQDKANALVLGTHGRAIWVLDHVDALAAIGPDLMTGGAKLLPVPPAHHEVVYSGQFWFGHGEYFAPNPPSGAVLTYYLPNEVRGGVQIAVNDASGKTIRTLRGPAQAGLNRVCWDLRQVAAAPERGPVPMASCIGTGNGRGDPGGANPGAPVLIPPSGVIPGGGGGGRGGRGVGPIVLPGKYTVAVTAGGSPMTADVMVVADPHFTISDADRQTRHTAILSAYALQQQLAGPSETARVLAEQMTALRQYFTAAGDSGKAGLASVAKAGAEVTRLQGMVDRVLNAAGQAQNAMDGYDGLPTEAQRRQVEWDWQDAATAVTALNRFIDAELPAFYSSLGGALKMPDVKASPVPSRR